MVGTTGFEPATSAPPVQRATKLRQVPICRQCNFFCLRDFIVEFVIGKLEISCFVYGYE
jgi:hypothetical protein